MNGKPMGSLERGCFDVCEDDISSSKFKDTVQSEFEQPCPGRLLRRTSGMEPGKLDNLERSCSLPKYVSSGERKNFLSESLTPEDVLSPRKVNGDGDREYLLPKYQSERNYSGSLLYRQKRDANNHASASMHAMQDTSEGPIVQHKGRFKITSLDLSPKDAPTTCLVNQLSGGSTTPPATTASVLQSLQYILQQNSIQREQIVRLIKFVGQSSEVGDLGTSDLSQISLASAKEKELQAQMVNLQQSIGILVEELQRLKMQNAQLERHLSALLNKEDERTRKENQDQL